MNLLKLIVILGPTASGKTETAIKLAKKFNAEIVSADSRQIYKKMDIGTAKPNKKDLKGIPYHLINIVKPDKDFNVALFKKLAVEKIRQIDKRGKIPFLVGGTGLYIKAVVDNVNFPKVIPDKQLRNKLERKTKKELFKIYGKLDPAGAPLIDKNNKRRLIRAIEVCESTGQSFWLNRKKQKPIFDVLEIGIKISKSDLKKRIEKRTEKMLRSDLEKETRKLVKKYGWIPSLHTIGYQEFKEYFEEKIFEEELKNLIELHTLQFVKRQITWFKKDKNIRWIKSEKQAEKLIKNFIG